MVFGGTAHYGAHIVKKLVEKGETVKVLSRNAFHAKEKPAKMFYKIFIKRPEITEQFP